MKLVTIESPYAGDTVRNETYLYRAIRDCFSRGEAPFASHGLYPRAIPDADPVQRKLGIEAGFEWTRRASNLVAVYTDYGTSLGMQAGIDFARYHQIPVEFRKIGENPQ